MWIERLVLTDFRNHAALSLQLDRRPVVITGPNGAGKTNILEAVSLLAPGQGLRRSAYPELARLGGNGSWAVSATLQGDSGPIQIGTGLSSGAGERAGRIVRIDGNDQPGGGGGGGGGGRGGGGGGRGGGVGGGAPGLGVVVRGRVMGAGSRRARR
jgi:DNA replication and repair protein RecF